MKVNPLQVLQMLLIFSGIKTKRRLKKQVAPRLLDLVSEDRGDVLVQIGMKLTPS